MLFILLWYIWVTFAVLLHVPVSCFVMRVSKTHIRTDISHGTTYVRVNIHSILKNRCQNFFFSLSLCSPPTSFVICYSSDALESDVSRCPFLRAPWSGSWRLLCWSCRFCGISMLKEGGRGRGHGRGLFSSLKLWVWSGGWGGSFGGYEFCWFVTSRYL